MCICVYVNRVCVCIMHIKCNVYAHKMQRIYTQKRTCRAVCAYVGRYTRVYVGRNVVSLGLFPANCTVSIFLV